MATEVIHDHTSGGDVSGIVLGIILLIVFMLFFWYAVASGAFQRLIPSSGSTNINIPDKVDVNLNQNK